MFTVALFSLFYTHSYCIHHFWRPSMSMNLSPRHFSNGPAEDPFFVRQSASWFPVGDHSILWICLFCSSSLTPLISIMSLLSDSDLVEFTASQRDLQSETQTIGGWLRVPHPCVSSEYNVPRKRQLSMPSAMANVSAASVLHTTLFILLDCQCRRENCPESSTSNIFKGDLPEFHRWADFLTMKHWITQALSYR